MYALSIDSSIPYAVTKIAKQYGGGKYVPGAQRTSQRKDFELILMVKMETSRRGTIWP